MTRHIISFNNECEISYEDGLSNNEEQKGFWLKVKNQATGTSEESKINPPVDMFFPTVDQHGLEIERAEISIIAYQNKHFLFRRHIVGDSEKNCERYITETNSWTSIASNQVTQNGAFAWHDQRNEVFDPLNGPFINYGPLSASQKNVLEAMLIGDGGSDLYNFKASCTSAEEYKKGLYSLIHGGDSPHFLLPSTDATFAKLKSYLTADVLHKLRLNAGNTYEGHWATLDEARDYVKAVFQKALKSADKNYNKQLPKSITSQGNYLCWPGELELVIDALNNHQQNGQPRPIPQVYELKQPANLQNKIKYLLQTIANVQEPGKVEIKRNASEKDLQEAKKALEELLYETIPITSSCHAYYPNHSLTKHVAAFLYAMSSQVNKDPNKSLQETFLIPLHQAIYHQINKLNQPLSSTQFQPLRVDVWNNTQRLATHADFVNEQLKNPYAIFIIPDNFDDAKLPDDKRHERQGRGGLAGPMAPIKVAGDRSKPVYDLCTFGIPTGGNFKGDTEAAKKEITQYFARLYAEIRKGRTIIVPHVVREGQLMPAFGTGTFADSAFTTQLRPFIIKEFKKLQNFCNNPQPENLEQAYKNAWENANTIPSLPLPKIMHPTKVSEETILLGKDLLNPGLRTKFKDWFLTKKLGELTEFMDGKNKALSGTLSTGAKILIRNVGISLEGTNEMTDEEFKNSMREVIQLYIDGYAPGEPPPTRVVGNEREKAITYALLEEAKIKLQPDPDLRSNTSKLPANTAGQRTPQLRT